MRIIYACIGETNCATGKKIPGHFFTFKSCIVCKYKVKRIFSSVLELMGCFEIFIHSLKGNTTIFSLDVL